MPSSVLSSVKKVSAGSSEARETSAGRGLVNPEAPALPTLPT
jgi:hypothetical protein